jgi:hypothetical protein
MYSDTYLCIDYWARLLPCIVEDVAYICNAICTQSIHCELHPFLQHVYISTTKSSCLHTYGILIDRHQKVYIFHCQSAALYIMSNRNSIIRGLLVL